MGVQDFERDPRLSLDQAHDGLAQRRFIVGCEPVMDGETEAFVFGEHARKT